MSNSSSNSKKNRSSSKNKIKKINMIVSKNIKDEEDICNKNNNNFTNLMDYKDINKDINKNINKDINKDINKNKNNNNNIII